MFFTEMIFSLCNCFLIDGLDIFSGLPGYPNFTDIVEMKKILQQLVDSLFVMTNKINRMQNAINYINNTFHERNESLKSVADTIAAMTNSLNNFNFNLKDINDTLKSFKLFMKDMNNSMFDIDDVIRYLDESIINLDETVAHLDDSVQDMNGTLLIIRVRAEDIDTSLKMINRTVIDVRDTTLSTNITLDSMNKTLLKLNDIIFSFGKKFDDVLNGLDGINISLRNINESIHNSYFRLNKLGDKIEYMNETIEKINSTMKRLNDSYDRIEEALRQMNESFTFLNGTALDELLDLSILNGTLGNVSFNVQVINNNKGIMNRSLTDALDWMVAMMETVNSLNVSIEKQNDSVIIGIKDKQVLDTLNSLLAMNGSLINTSKDVDDVNDNLSNMEHKMDVLEDSLRRIEDSLGNMNSTFAFLNNILSKINETLRAIDEPINSINGTLQSLTETSNKIEISLMNVEQTIESANKSTNTIHGFVLSAMGSAEHINETISNIHLKSDSLRESVKDFIKDNDALTGSLPEITQKLANDEEAINIMKEEYSILNESIGIVDDKLNVLKSTFDMMNGELNMTSFALDKSDANLVELERAIDEVHDTLINISQTLNGISSSLAELNAGFTNISSAFPNIDLAIHNVISSTNTLKKMAGILTDRNINSHMEGANSTFAASIIANNLVSLQNVMDDLGNTIAELVTTKVDGTSKLNTISGLLDLAGKKHEDNSKKVGLLNPSFKRLIERYNQLTDISANVIENSNRPNETLVELEQRLGIFKDILGNYSNLNIDLKKDSDNLTNIRNALFQTENLFNDSYHDFKLRNNSVWFENGRPRLYNVTIGDIAENIRNLNLTMKNHEDVLQEAYRTAGDVDTFSDVLHAKLDALNKTINDLDSVNSKSSEIDSSLGPLIEGYDNQINEIDYLIEQFKHQLNELDNIEGLYTNVSDSNTTVKLYGDIRRSLDELISQRQIVENERKMLHKTKKEYNKMLKDFENTNIGLNSEAILKKLLGDLDDTIHVIDELGAAWKETNNSVSLTNKFLEKIGSNINILERELKAKMKKDTYVNKYGQKIRNELETLPLTMNDTMKMIQQRNETISNLTDFISNLKEFAKTFNTLNITFTNEMHSLDDSSTTLEHIRRHLNDAVTVFGNTRKAYENFDTGTASFSEIKTKFQQYLSSVATLKDEVFSSQQKLTAMGTDLGTMDGNLQNISKHFVLFKSSAIYLNETGNDLIDVTKKLQSVEEKFNSSLEKFRDIRTYFSKIEKSYSNMSAGVLNTPAVYIRGLIEEKYQKLNVTVDSLANISKVYDITSISFQDVNASFWTTIFTRNNIMDYLLATNGSLDEIGENLNWLQVKLDHLDVGLSDINKSLQLMDGVVHERNQELFMERQKHLFVSENLPEILDLYNTVNESLTESEKRRIQIRNNISTLRMSKAEVHQLQDEFQNINITLTGTDAQLQESEQFTKIVSSTLGDLNTIFGNINRSVLSESAYDNFKDEPLEYTKSVFEESLRVLENISVNLSQVMMSADTQQSQLTLHQDALTNLTSLLDGYKMVHDKSIGHKIKENEMDHLSIALDGNLKQLITAMNDCLNNFTALEANYQSVNNTILNNTLFDLKNMYNNMSADLFHVLTEQNNTKAIMEDMYEILNNTDKQLTKTVSSPEYLKRLIIVISSEQENTEKIMRNVNLGQEYLDNKIAKLLQETYTLKDNLFTAERRLKTQQKREYIDQNLPNLQLRQSHLEDRMINASDNLLSADDLTSFITSLFNSTKATIEDHTKLNMSLKESSQTLQRISDVIKNDNGTLIGMRLENEKVKINLTQEYFQQNLDDFNIADLKSVFDTINASFNDFEKGIDIIDDNGQATFNKLDSIQIFFNNIDNGRDTMNSVGEVVNATAAKWTDYVNQFKSINDSVVLIEENISNITDDIIYLNETFAHVRDSNLRKRLHSIEDLLKNLHNQLDTVFNTLDDLDNNNTITAVEVNMLEHLKSLPVATLEELYSDIDQMTTMASRINSDTKKGQILLNEANLLADMLLTNLSHIHTVSKDLKRDFKRQEKIEFLEVVLPPLERKDEQVSSGLLQADNAVDNVREYLTNASNLLQLLAERLKTRNNVNISVSEFSERYRNAGSEVDELKSDLDMTGQRLHALNISGLQNDTSLTEDSFPMLNLTHYITDLDKELNKTWSKINSSKMITNALLKELDEFDSDISEILSDLDTLSDLENETSMAERSLSKLQKSFTNTDSKIETLIKNLLQLNASLEEVIMDMDGLNNTELMQKIKRFQNKLDADIMKTLELDHQLREENNTVINASDILKALISIFDSVSNSKTGLERKLEEGSKLLNILNKDTTKLLNTIPAINGNIPEIDSDVENFKHELENIQKAVEQQKIESFIKNNFPDLLETFSRVNNTVLGQTRMLQSLETAIHGLQNRTMVIEDRLSRHSPLNMTMGDVWQKSEEMMNVIENAQEILNNISQTFSNIGLELTKESHTNDTIENIKDRFSRKLGVLMSLNIELNNLTEPLDMIDKDTKIYNDELSNSNKTISFYESMLDRLASLNSFYDSLNTTSEDILNGLANNSESISTLDKGIQRISRRFSNVSDERLNQTNEATRMNVSKEGEYLSFLQELHNVTYENFLNQRKALVESELLLKTSVDSFQKLQTHLSGVLNATKALTEKGSLIKTNFTDILATLGNQAELLPKINEEILTLEDLYKAKEKEDFIDAYLPLLNDLIDRARKLFNESMIEAGHTGANKAQFQLDKMNELLESHQLLNIPTDTLQSLIENMYHKLNESENDFQNEVVMFKNLNFSSFHPNTYSQLPIQKLRSEYARLNQSLHDILFTVADIDRTVNNTIQDSISKRIFMNATSITIDTYLQLHTQSDIAGKILNQTKMKVDNTSNMFIDLHQLLQSQMSDLNNILLYSSDISNATKDLIEEFSNITNAMAFDLPFIREHFIESVVEPALENEKTFNMTAEILSNTITTFEQLEYITSTAEDQIANVTETNKYLNGKTLDYQQKIHSMQLQLEKNNKTLLRIKELMRRENKESFIQKKFPDIVEKYEKLNISLTRVFKELKSNNISLNKVHDHLKSTKNETDTIKHISTLTKPQTEEIDIINEELVDMLANLSSTAEAYSSFNVSKLNDREQIFNDEISISQIEELYMNYNKSFRNLESTANYVSNRNGELKLIITSIDDQLNELDDMLLLSSTVEKSIVSLETQIVEVQYDMTELSNNAEEANVVLQKFNNSLSQLKKNYGHFLDNTTREEMMIDKAKSKINALRSFLDDAKKDYEMLANEHKINNATFYQPINTSDTLQYTLETVSRQLPSTEMKTEKLADKLNKARNEIPVIETTLKSITDSVNELEWMMGNQQNKSNIFKTIKPFTEQKLLSASRSFRQTNNSIQNVTSYGHSVKDALNDINDRLRNIPEVNVPLTDLDGNVSDLMDKIAALSDGYNKLWNTFESLNTEISSYNVLNESLTVEDVERKYDNFNLTLHDIIQELIEITDQANTLQPKFEAINNEVGEINSTLDQYLSEETEIANLGTNLYTAEMSLKETKDFIKKLTENVENITASFMLLNEQYSDVTHTAAENISKAESALQIADDFLLDVVTSVENLTSQLSDVKNGLITGYEILHGDIDTYDKLNESVKDVFKQNNEIRKQLENIQNKIVFVNNDTMSVNASLEDIPYMLDNLRKLLNREQKRKYINNVYPRYESSFEYMNVSLSDVFDELKVTKDLLRSVTETLQLAKTKIMNIPSIRVSMENYQDQIINFDNTLEKLFVTANNASKSYASLDSTDLIGQNILETDTITLKILQDKYNSSGSVLNKTKASLEWIEQQNTILISDAVGAFDNINRIIYSLNRFEKVRNDFDKLSEDVHTARTNKTEVNGLLDNAKDRIRSADILLSQLELSYSEIEYNSSSERQMIQKIKDIISALDIKFSNVSSQVLLLENEIKDTKRTLYDIIDDPKVLNNTLLNVKMDIVSLQEALDTFRLSLNYIKNNIPNINMGIDGIDSALSDMENVLTSQQNKAHFVENAKPALQDRLDNTMNAFRTTNLSLELMRQQIEELQAYVDAVNNRLDGLPTVNISLTDIGSNITEMENRLIIMQDYYENVQEVISQLHGSIDYFDIFDTNLTLDNVESRYSMFNHTIDDVNSVLGKIGREFNAFGSQFTSINSTLGNIDDAISRFEDKTTKIKVLENDVQSFGSLLNDTNRNIEDMLSATRQLNDSFLIMKQNYSEVINRTEEKNIDIEQKINDVDKYLKNAKKIIDNVAKLYLASQSNVSMINQSLFKDIYTYKDLNTTLTDVKGAYATIRSQLKDMRHIIEHKSNETNGYNSTLIGVSSFLEDLKQILTEEQMDLEKVKYINSHIDDLNSQFTALKTPFANTKDSITKHSKEIGDVHLLAKKTGNRLNRFRTLEISTDPEKRKAEELKSLMTELNTNLTATDETILKIQNLMSSLENRNVSIDDIKAKFVSVNSSINALNATLDDIHNKLKKAKTEAGESSDTLLKFQSQMNEFKSLQRGLAKVRNLMKILDARTSESVNDLGETETTLYKLDKTVQAMDLMQTILDDPDYKVFQPKAVSSLTTFNESHAQLDKTSTEMLTKLDQAKQSLDKLVKSIKQSLTRENITKAMADLQSQLENTTKFIDELNTPTKDNNKKANDLLSDVQKFDINAENMKDILTKELDKYQLVKNTLPTLQAKHGIINQSLVDVKPTVKDVKSKLAHIKEVMAKIKEKMSIFGVEDSDGMVLQWDKQINKIENTIKETILKHRNSVTTINRLKKDLWKDVKDMFTKDETLEAVNSRLDQYNKTLDEIDVSLDAKTIDLKDIDILANKIGQDLADRNMILTTTPATTTPSGAPECK